MVNALLRKMKLVTDSLVDATCNESSIFWSRLTLCLSHFRSKCGHLVLFHHSLLRLKDMNYKRRERLKTKIE